MNLLAIETATDMCSVALCVNEQIFQHDKLAPQQHAQLVMPLIEAMLAEAQVSLAQLDGLVFGQGPGSFTGVRIAAAVTQGIAFGAGLPVVGVSSLQAIAQQQVDQLNNEHVLVALDARMKEVYWGAYAKDNNGIMQAVVDEQLSAPTQIDFQPQNYAEQWLCAGSGVEQYENDFQHLFGDTHYRCISDQRPTAAPMLAIAKPVFAAGRAKVAEQALPVYLRNKVALTEQERASGQTL